MLAAENESPCEMIEQRERSEEFALQCSGWMADFTKPSAIREVAN
jgi:hypothetical protein